MLSIKSSRFCLLACEIFRHEVTFLLETLSDLPSVEVYFLPKGLHDVETEMRRMALCKVVREADESEKYGAILLGYGLCSGGIVGLKTQKTPLVAPRVHDCIALFFGGCQPYENYFFAQPGTYFQTAGWQELGENLSQFPPDSFQKQCGAGESLETFCEKYGPENGPYLWRELGDMRRHYTRLVFLKTSPKTDAEAEKFARKQAEDSGWEFDVLAGDLSLLADLLRGKWDAERFLVLPPGQEIRQTFDCRLIDF